MAVKALAALRRGKAKPGPDPAGLLAQRAGIAHAEGRLRDAAALFREAAALRPDLPDFHIQAGHMFKEAGDLADAERHYRAALALAPDDADLALQMGHFLKTAARVPEAVESYRRATELKPGWGDPAAELARLSDFSKETGALQRARGLDKLVPSLVPRTPEEMLESHREHIHVARLGRREPGSWGMRHTLRGVEAIRGFVISETPIAEVQLILNGVTIHRGPLKGGYVLQYERDKDRIRKYVFNIWLDMASYARGLYPLELRFLDADEGTRSWHGEVVLAPPIHESEYPDSDALVSLTPGDPRGVEEQIRARPSMVRSAKRNLFPDGVRQVLVMRTDQLGDMVASIPAMRRLREIAPEARIVGLLTGANAELGRTLGLFDEIITVDFPDDPIERRRIMPLETQQALRERLQGYDFDIAIDLAQSDVSRPLLLLTGAKLLFGTGGGDTPWLSENIFNTRDRWSGMDMTPHASKVQGLIESLGTFLTSHAPVIRRPELTRDLLAPYGIGPDDEYVVLHGGARVIFSRWQHYPALARLLLERTGYKVVLISEDAGFGDTVPADLLAEDRLIFLDKRLSFDVFDAFISFAKAMVGNDSGPKHLAALRGTNVVTIFTARINWAEWAQENIGSVISRRVPCQGCAIFHDAEECGKDFACVRDIGLEEVYTALGQYL